MGVTFHNVHHALPYKLIRKLDTFLQKIGRAGREGHLSDEQIMHKKSHINRVESELVRLHKDDSKCRHELLCEAYILSNKR